MIRTIFVNGAAMAQERRGKVRHSIGFGYTAMAQWRSAISLRLTARSMAQLWRNPVLTKTYTQTGVFLPSIYGAGLETHPAQGGAL